MRPHYLRSENGHRDRWMISYMDVLTILLIFFVAIAAQTLQQQKATAATPPSSSAPSPVAASSASVTAASGSVTAMNTAHHVNADETIGQEEGSTAEPPVSQLSMLEQKLKDQDLDVRIDSRGLVISLPQAVLFASGDDRINRNALPAVDRIATVLQEIPNPVSLAGHADAVPIHNRRFKNNWELSAARSLRLLALLTERYGISESRLAVESYGSYDPKSSNGTAEGRASNRRVEIVIGAQD